MIFQKKNKNNIKAVEKYYQEKTDQYLRIYGDVIQAYRPSNTAELLDYTMTSAGLKDHQRIVDAGCGVCGPAIHFASNLDIQIEALTLSKKQVEVSRQRIAETGLTEKINVRKGDYHLLDQIYESDSYDHVLFLEALGHSAEPEKAILTAHRILKHGGFIYIKDFFVREVSDPAFQQRIEKVIRNINTAYAYNTLDLHPIITALRKAGFHLVFIKRPEFENDIHIRAAFETAENIDLYEGKTEFMPAEWLEIKCQKLSW